MQSRIDEVSPGVYRISHHTRDAGKAGLLYNQFLIASPFPLLFHTGQPYMFDAVRDAVATVIDPGRRREGDRPAAARSDDPTGNDQGCDRAA